MSGAESKPTNLKVRPGSFRPRHWGEIYLNLRHLLGMVMHFIQAEISKDTERPWETQSKKTKKRHTFIACRAWIYFW